MSVFKNKIDSNKLSSIVKTLSSCELGFGENVSLLEKKFNQFSNKDYNIATSSASAAAFILFSYLKDIYGVCDVYVPSLTFNSPVWAAYHNHHNIIFIDVQDDGNFCCEDYLQQRESEDQSGRVKVVMPTLYSGVSTIKNFKLLGDEIVIVDSAHCVTPTINSDFIFFSFHPQKPICSSDGGMLCCNDSTAKSYFESFRNFGRSDHSCFDYDIIRDGFKFYMNNLNAAIALSQLDNQKLLTRERKKRFEMLQASFGNDLCEHDPNSTYYFATLISEKSNYFNKKYKLKKLYPPLHKTSFYKDANHRVLPNTDRIYENLCNIPLSHFP